MERNCPRITRILIARCFGNRMIDNRNPLIDLVGVKLLLVLVAATGVAARLLVAFVNG